MAPPGLDGVFTEVSSGGSADWMPVLMRKSYTNAFVVDGSKVLLGYKKRGFGKSLYNGFGGKVDPGETPAEAAIRELGEEAGIEAPLEHCGTFLFVSESLEWACHIYIYRAHSYAGDIIETEEMKPEWFTLSGSSKDPAVPPIPWDKMWESDRFWLPLLFAKHHFAGRSDFVLKDDIPVLQKWWFGVSPCSDSDAQIVT